MILDEGMQIVKIIEHAWPGPSLGKETLLIMITAISDLPFDLTKKVMTRLVQTNQFRPSIAEVRRNVARELGLLPPPVDVALEQAVVYASQVEQWSYYNGSGWKPDPITEPNPLVKKIANRINFSRSDWMKEFQIAYSRALKDELAVVLASSLNDLALEAGE